MQPRPRLKRLVALSCLLALVACGGGGDGKAGTGSGGTIDQPAGAAKYVGTWVACMPFDAGHSFRHTYVIPPMQSDLISVTATLEVVGGPACSGEVIGRQEVAYDVGWLDQTKLVDGITTDKVGFAAKQSIASGDLSLIDSPLAGFNQVVAIVNGQLREGDLESTSADTFPEHLTGTAYAKQP